MMFQAVLGNPGHPEYGVATIPFPIPHDQYAHCMELLEALEIGDAVKADCKVEKIDSFYTVLKRTEMLTVNVEELNYLAKRLDGFDAGEAAQFQAMAYKLELFELKDLINLAFCCQQTTVITDFSDLAAIGRDHYMNLHGGSVSVDELNALDGKKTARQLIENGGGTITPYGVVYDNGMKLEQVYDGRFFPCYYYKPNVITVAVTSKAEPEDTEHITWLFLPMVQEEIDRALLRGGITDSEDVRLRLEDSQLPNEVDILLDMEYMKRMDGSAGWSDAGVFIPYDIYKQYGDVVILEKNFPQMARYAEYKIGTLGKFCFPSRPTGISWRYRKQISNCGQSYGEWAEPADVKDFAVSEFIFPHPEETTAYIALLMDRMQEIAAILGRADAAARYADVAVRVREGYQHLMTVPKFSLDTDRQAKLVRPLHLKMLNKQQTEYAKKRLLKALDNYGWRLGTGFLSTPFILDVLTEMDVEYAYRLLENEELPGWLCMPKQGATTIWENWEGPNTTKPASLNHYSKGAVCRWVFDTMCGIHVDGENHFVITPQPGGHFSYAKACYQSIFGMVESGWVRDGERCAFTVTVPANCTATVRLPDGTERTQECGTQTYTV